MLGLGFKIWGLGISHIITHVLSSPRNPSRKRSGAPGLTCGMEMRPRSQGLGGIGPRVQSGVETATAAQSKAQVQITQPPPPPPARAPNMELFCELPLCLPKQKGDLIVPWTPDPKPLNP